MTNAKSAARRLGGGALLLRDAREEGREEGRQEGRQEGLAVAKASALDRLLTRRFGPPWATLRLQQATPEQLDTWLDRVLDTPTLQAVLDGP